jgi:hypothetical protein
MAAKQKAPVKRATVAVKSSSAKPAARKGVVQLSKAEVARLMAENAGLLQRLAVANEKVARLERQRDEALNRIEWAIDSIQTLSDEMRKTP